MPVSHHLGSCTRCDDSDYLLVKAYIRRHGHALRQNLDPVACLYEACGCVTAEMCEGWFRHAGYIV